MCNVAGDGDGECGGERLMVNAVGNFDVECSRERLREIWWRTVMLGCNA